MKKWIVTISTVCVAMSAMSEAPEMFRYQGRLVEGTSLVNAILPMSFKLYDAEIGGLLLYEDSASVQVVDGLYSTFIGDDTVSGSLLDALDNPTVYLELTINGETLSPRERIVSSPYALQTLSDPTPAGTIVLSETYPNTQLEAEGYSVYYEDPTQADWDEVDRGVPSIGTGGKVFSFKNKLGLLKAMPMMDEEDVFLTEDGKSWETGTSPISYDSMSSFSVVLDDTLYIYKGNVPYCLGCSTTDFVSWSTWTNRFTTNMYDYTATHIVAFNGALWAFTRDMNVMGSYPVMRSIDGINWTKMSDGDWGDLYMNGRVLVSDNKLRVVATGSAGPEDLRVWSSTDGISWHKSTATVPSGLYGPTLIDHNNALWTFFKSSPTDHGEAWQSTNDGDSWTLVTTNLPNYTIMSAYKIISHDGKLWLWGNDSTMGGALLWSINAVEGETTLTTGSLSESATLVGLPNGRLWLYAGDSPMNGPALYYAGGPKKDDGLYYYKKD